MKIRYFFDDVSFNLKRKRKITSWLEKVAKNEKKTIDNLCYVFVSDEKIQDMNCKYLHHDYTTDILTFDLSSEDAISGDMYISVETVKENAKDYNVDFQAELLRVMLHGVLHLCGYNDGTEEEQKEMRGKEDEYLVMVDTSANGT